MSWRTRESEWDEVVVQVAIPLFDELTALDAIGPYEVLRRAPGWEVVFLAAEPGAKRDEGSLALVASRSLADVPDPDIMLVPGGLGTRTQRHDELLGWIRSAHEASRWTMSVCTGSILLARAGLLAGRKATTHWMWLDQLGELGAEPVEERFVEDGKIITAAGVSAGIDMALHLLRRELGQSIAEAVQLSVEYDPQPPVDSGSTRKASPEVIDLVRRATHSAESNQARYA